MSKHTPGPWTLTEAGLITTPRGDIAQVLAVAVDRTPEVLEEERANGHLLEAAPDLLIACELAYEVLAPRAK